MPTLVESLKERLERVTKKYGSDRQYTKSLQQQITALETGKDARQLYVGGGRSAPMPTPPTGKTGSKSENSPENKPASLDLARATKQVSAAMDRQGSEAVEED